jgi:hypothetical protein
MRIVFCSLPEDRSPNGYGCTRTLLASLPTLCAMLPSFCFSDFQKYSLVRTLCVLHLLFVKPVFRGGGLC